MTNKELLEYIENKKIKNILVIQTAFIGDVVLTTPMLKTLKQYFPDSHISVLVKPEAKQILEPLSFVDEVLIIDKSGKHKFLGMFQIIQQIRKKKFDIILSPHQSFRTGLIVFFSGVPIRIGYESSSLPIAYNIKLKRSSKHEIHRLLDFLKDSICPDLKNYTNAPILEETEESKNKARTLIQELSTNPIAFACSSIWPTKRWTPWGFAELAGKVIELYQAPVILIGSKSDFELSEYIRNYAKHILPDHIYNKIYNFCGRTDLITLYSLLKRCKFLVSNDSAPVHFGCAAKIPVIAIFGPTTKDLGYAPICKNSRVVEIEGLYCRPCGTHGGKKCPEKHFRCMKEITPNMVLEKIKEVYPIKN
ncbi:MAG: ADP-heptose--LPS heptosyltransferase II [Leptospiraceae bacterium]|nr:MAG: ADP-heptose--LPS heptosyltransferase II [Leptospiraceae bacterium]